MVTDPIEPPETLGLRLDRQARRLMSARPPTFMGLHPMRVLLDHLTSLSEPSLETFDRVEVVDSPIEFHDRVDPVDTTIDDDSDPGAGHRLSSDVQAQLDRVIRRDASAMRVHQDSTADAVARAYHAEAVTLGRDVYFRQDRFRPREQDGFGLLAHEATHVAELLSPGAAWRRLTHGGRRDEEQLAEANERRGSLDSAARPARLSGLPRRSGVPHPGAVGFLAARPDQSQPVVASPSMAPSAAPAPPELQPMPADEDRATDMPAPLDLQALQQGLLAELKHQLRTEFERGA